MGDSLQKMVQSMSQNLTPKIVALEEASQESATKCERLSDEISGHGTSRDKHEARLKELSTSFDSLQQKHSDNLKEHHASVQDRLAYLEAFVQDSGDKYEALRAEQEGLKVSQDSSRQSI